MNDKKKILLIVVPIAIFLLITSFVFGLIWAGQPNSDSFESDAEDVGISTSVLPEHRDDDKIEKEEEIVLDESKVEVGEITVDWIAVEDQKLTEGLSVLVNAFDKTYENPKTGEISNYGPKWSAVNLGEIVSGVYAGRDLTLQMSEEDGMGIFYKYYYVAIDPDGLELPILFDNYYAPQSSIFSRPEKLGSASETAYWTEDEKEKLVGRLLIDTTTVIADITPEEFVKAGKVSLVFAGVGKHVLFPEPTGDELTGALVGTLENGTKVYRVTSKTGATTDLFSSTGPDGRISIYDIDIPFWHSSELVKTPYLIWNDGSVNEGEYLKSESLGCGYRPTNTRDDVLMSDLEMAGTFLSANGTVGSVYEYKEWSKDDLESEFNIWKNGLELGEGDEAWDQFISSHAIFFYQDELDRIIMFRSSSIDAGAECGKPVIYLYPEVETNIEVKLELEGGFSITEPEYKDGWRVTAKPDGTLINLEDGVEYPYLFWEGNGGIYVPPSNYWVVAKDDVPTFLVDTLAELGLNERETADFMEFWAPRMEASPWYKISFYGTNVMNLIAPLEISKNPDTLLRVLMDYEELDAPIAENPITLPRTPERNGFTVIEWGGVLK